MWVWASRCWVRACSRSRWSCSATVCIGHMHMCMYGVHVMHTAYTPCIRHTAYTIRAALAHPLERIPFCGMTLRRSAIWACGLGLYCIANALKVVALMYGPMTVRVGMHTTCRLPPRSNTRPCLCACACARMGAHCKGVHRSDVLRTCRCSLPSSARCSSSTCSSPAASSARPSRLPRWRARFSS